jgi:hypothetical protein
MLLWLSDHMTIAKDEIFGPVQSILKWDTLDEVSTLALSNETLVCKYCIVQVLLQCNPSSFWRGGVRNGAVSG